MRSNPIRSCSVSVLSDSFRGVRTAPLLRSPQHLAFASVSTSYLQQIHWGRADSMSACLAQKAGPLLCAHHLGSVHGFPKTQRAFADNGHPVSIAPARPITSWISSFRRPPSRARGGEHGPVYSSDLMREPCIGPGRMLRARLSRAFAKDGPALSVFRVPLEVPDRMQLVFS